MLTIDDTREAFGETRCTVAVLPIGAVEQHGAHLPVGTDLMLAEAMAKPLAEKLDAYLLPAIAISSSIEHRKAKGTVYLRAETLALVVRDIAESLRTSGFERLVLVNFHGGNWILKPTIRQLNRDLAKFRIVLLGPDLVPSIAREILEHPEGDIHGGEFETSLMLHLFPDAVRELPKGGSRKFPSQPMLDYFDSTELAREGFWGWPECATAEKGRRIFSALVDAQLKFLRQLDRMDEHLGEAAESESALRLREFRLGDIPFANSLRASAGWNQVERDWRGYLEFEPRGCFVAEVEGHAAGTATTIRYEDKFGWIGMVLVHPNYRRLGVGSRLLRAAIAYLQEQEVRCVKLDATPMGKKVYVPLGFVDEYDLARYEGAAPATVSRRESSSCEVVEFAAGDLAEIVRFDATAFGAERGNVLRSLSARNPELCFEARERGAVAGYIVAREGANAVQVGPWVAQTPAVAEQLLAAFFERVKGRPVFIDVIDPNRPAVELMQRLGFSVQRTLTRMFLGQNAHAGEPRMIYGISSAEKG